MTTTDTPIHIVAVHGNGGGSFRFKLLPHVLREATASRPPVRFTPITLPGFEGMPLPPSPDRGTFVGAIGNEVTDLRRRRPRDAVVLLGHGIGGSFVLDALAHRSIAADGAILHAPVGASLERRLFPRLMRPRAVREAVRLAIGSRLAGFVGPRVLFGGTVPPAYTRRFLAEYRRCAAFSVMFDLLTPQWFEGLEVSQTPTALLWGAEDRVLRSEHVAAFQSKLADHRTVIVDRWGHFPMIEQPLDYAARIADLACELVA